MPAAARFDKNGRCVEAGISIDNALLLSGEWRAIRPDQVARGWNLVLDNGEIRESTVEEASNAEVTALRKEVAVAVAADSGLILAAARFFGYMEILEGRGVKFPAVLTFFGAIEAMEAVRGTMDAALEGLKLRVLYDDVVYHCDGSMQTAYRYLPVLAEMLRDGGA